MAHVRGNDRVVQTASGRLYRLGDLTPEYALAFERWFQGAPELARYLSSSLRRLNVTAIVARMMAAYLGRHNPRAREEIFCRCDVWRLQILYDDHRLQHLYACVRATPFGEAGMKERWDRFRQLLEAHVQIVPDDWQRPALGPEDGFTVAVWPDAARRLQPSPPGVRESDMETIEHLLFIADAVLSRSFGTEFPPDISKCKSHDTASRRSN